jgi:hypothetical protein
MYIFRIYIDLFCLDISEEDSFYVHDFCIKYFFRIRIADLLFYQAYYFSISEAIFLNLFSI